MNSSERKMPVGLKYALRVLAMLALPIATILGSSLLMWAVTSFGSEHRLFYLRAETTLIMSLLLAIAFMVALALRWTGKKVISLRVAGIALAGFFLIVAGSGAVETVNTRPVLAIADSFVPPAGLEREYEMNEDEFSPAPGIIPCWDLMGEGCPHINRAWKSDTPLTLPALEKSLHDSGWDTLRVKETGCNVPYNPAGDNREFCSAEGEMNGYKVSASIMNSYGERGVIRIYIRPLDTTR